MTRYKTQSDVLRVIGDIQMANFIQQAQSSQVSEKAKRAAITTTSRLAPAAEYKSVQQENPDARTYLINVLLWHNNDLQST